MLYDLGLIKKRDQLGGGLEDKRFFLKQKKESCCQKEHHNETDYYEYFGSCAEVHKSLGTDNDGDNSQNDDRQRIHHEIKDKSCRRYSGGYAASYHKESACRLTAG